MIKKNCLIITRPSSDAKRTANFLSASGFEYFIESTVSVKTLHGSKSEFLNSVQFSEAIIITSNNAVTALKEFHCLQTVKIICVGTYTSEFAASQGFTNVICAGKNIAEMQKYIKQNELGKNLVYASGSDITEELCLENCSAHIKRIIVYNIISAEKFSQTFKDKLINGDFYGVLFFSKRHAEIFYKLLEKEGLKNYLNTLIAFCFSKKITSHIKRYGFKATMSPKNANLESFSELLSNFNLHK